MEGSTPSLRSNFSDDGRSQRSLSACIAMPNQIPNVDGAHSRSALLDSETSVAVKPVLTPAVSLADKSSESTCPVNPLPEVGSVRTHSEIVKRAWEKRKAA